MLLLKLWQGKITSVAIRITLEENKNHIQFSLDTQSGLTLCNPHGLQYTRLPCPSPTPGACSNSCLLSPSSDAIQPSHPLPSPSPPAFYLSQYQGLFQWVSFSHRWPKYWSFSFHICPSYEYSRLIFFTIDWLDLLAVQGTLKSLLQIFSSKESILQCLAFCIFQISHPYMITEKVIALTIWIFVGKVMSVLFNTLSSFVITILSRRASLVVQMVKNPRAVQETQVWSLSWEDPLEKEMATHSSILPLRILWTEESRGCKESTLLSD